VELAHLVQEAVFKDLFVLTRQEQQEQQPLGALLKPQEQQQTDLILPHLHLDQLVHSTKMEVAQQEQEMETVPVTTVIWRQRRVQLPIQETCRVERRELQEMVAPMNQPKLEAREVVALEAVAAEPSRAHQEARAAQVKFITDS